MIVTLPELRAHLRLADDREDALLATYEAAAVSQAETFLGSALIGAGGLFADVHAVPAAVRLAVMLLAAGWFAERQGFDTGPALELLRPWRRASL